MRAKCLSLAGFKARHIFCPRSKFAANGLAFANWPGYSQRNSYDPAPANALYVLHVDGHVRPQFAWGTGLTSERYKA